MNQTSACAKTPYLEAYPKDQITIQDQANRAITQQAKYQIEERNKHTHHGITPQDINFIRTGFQNYFPNNYFDCCPTLGKKQSRLFTQPLEFKTRT